MNNIKRRLSHWQSTVPGLAVIAVVAYAIKLKPELIDNPVALLTLAGGLYGLFKDKAS